ncbi:MAG: efflux RND transporter periplasmic adaptor subunit [Pseudomonadota bacterium]
MKTSFLSSSLVLWLTAFLTIPNVQAQTRVAVVSVKEQPVQQQLTLPASVASLSNSYLSFGIAGRVERYLVDVGDTVKKGEALAELDQRQVDATLESLNAQQQSATATLDDERQQLDELQSLAKTDFVAQSELRRARADVQVAESALAEVKARINELEVDRGYHQLVAPFSGLVTDRNIDPGQWVTESQQAFQLVDLKAVYIDAFVAQRYFSRITPETQVSVSTNGDRNVAAEIDKISAFASGNERSFRVRIKPAPESNLLVGSSVNVILTMTSEQPAPTVPQDAVIRYSDGRTSVWEVVEEDGNSLAKERWVTLGQRFNGWVEIVDGLSGEKQVVVRGNEALTDGDKVQTEESNAYD